MRRPLILAVLLVTVNLVVSAAVQGPHIINGVAYLWPGSHAAGLLSVSDDATNTLAWASGPELTDWPEDLVVASPTGACPTGWTEYTGLRGRAPVGLVSGGTLAADIGTALTNSENRPVGTHSHSVTDGGHNHTQAAHAHGVSDPGHAHAIWGTTSFTFDQSSGIGSLVNVTTAGGTTSSSTGTTDVTVQDGTGTTSSATTGVSVNVTGTVAGTNAPYGQWMYCQTPEAE